jgi:hypothetical protein
MQARSFESVQNVPVQCYDACMTRYSIPLCACIAASGALMLGVLATGISSTRAQSVPKYYNDVVRIMEGIRSAGPPNRDTDQPIPEEGPLPDPVFDDSAPALALPRALEALQRLLPGSQGIERLRLRQAVGALQSAWSYYVGGADVGRRQSSSTGHLQHTQEQILTAVTALNLAVGPSKITDPQIKRLRAEIVAVAARISADIYRVTRQARVPAERLRPIRRLLDLAAAAQKDERYAAAVALYGASTTLSGGMIDFNIDLFEQNIRDALDNQTIGYTYAITLFDTIHTSDGVGNARIPPDFNAPEPQSPNKESYVASVSKTLTAIVVLRLLEMNGLDPDDPIGPWLPPGWDVGNGVASQTFRDFLTHQTGFTQKGVDPDGDNTLAFIENAVGTNVPFNTGFSYNNANFGIFRILVPRLAGFDFDAFPGYSDEELYGGFFVYAALNFFESVDVSVTCNVSQPNPTFYYSVPHNNFNGLQPAADYSLECGGYGFFASSKDLGPILADLAAGDELISDESVMLMKEGQLGFFNPANGYFWGNGGLGLYHNHGGDWTAGIKGLDTCVMLFPIGITANLLINSIGGNYGGAGIYQCEVLRNAFDAAWEPN